MRGQRDRLVQATRQPGVQRRPLRQARRPITVTSTHRAGALLGHRAQRGRAGQCGPVAPSLFEPMVRGADARRCRRRRARAVHRARDRARPWRAGQRGVRRPARHHVHDRDSVVFRSGLTPRRHRVCPRQGRPERTEEIAACKSRDSGRRESSFLIQSQGDSSWTARNRSAATSFRPTVSKAPMCTTIPATSWARSTIS